MFQVHITPSARKEAKKLAKQAREFVVEASKTLEQNPYAGERLTGSLHMLYSFHFSAGGVQYWMAYHVDEKQKLVIVHLVQSRENFYKKLKRIFR